MADLRLTETALADLEDIRNIGVADFGADVAEHHLVGIRRQFDLLPRHPLAGQARPEFRQGIRTLSHRRHRILYTVADDVVLIVRVIHQARDVAAALRDGS